jgi:transcriptional regulator with XRE-family HTH domain
LPVRKPTRQSRALADTIRQLRLERRISQETLASEAGLGVHYIAQLERHYHRASFDAIAQIADALGISLSELVDAYEARLRKRR